MFMFIYIYIYITVSHIFRIRSFRKATFIFFSLQHSHIISTSLYWGWKIDFLLKYSTETMKIVIQRSCFLLQRIINIFNVSQNLCYPQYV